MSNLWGHCALCASLYFLISQIQKPLWEMQLCCRGLVFSIFFFPCLFVQLLKWVCTQRRSQTDFFFCIFGGNLNVICVRSLSHTSRPFFSREAVVVWQKQRGQWIVRAWRGPAVPPKLTVNAAYCTQSASCWSVHCLNGYFDISWSKHDNQGWHEKHILLVKYQDEEVGGDLQLTHSDSAKSNPDTLKVRLLV